MAPPLNSEQFNTSLAPSTLPTDSYRPSAEDYEIQAYKNRPVDTGAVVLKPHGMKHTARAQPSYPRRLAVRIGNGAGQDKVL